MSVDDISANAIPIAVEDKFLVLAFGTGQYLCPSTNDADHLGDMLMRLKDIDPIFDLRGLEGYYKDIDEFIRNVGGENSYVILGKDETEAGWGRRLAATGFEIIRARGQAHNTALLEIDLFDCNAEDFMEDAIFGFGIGDYDDAVELAYDIQFEKLQEFVVSNHRNSLLVEFVMAAKGDRVTLCPYHGHAIHDVETRSEKVLVGRPAVIARNTRGAFSDEITELEHLVNNSSVKERDIQKFLENHPNFLRGLNYQNIYPQIILERESEGPLIPDFILEPFDGAFCDILDIKLPRQSLYVGGKDRGRLAAGLHEVAAQLREYAAYFEQEKYRRFVREKYGLRLYKPRLIAVVGRVLVQREWEERPCSPS
jgi:hypothetical protein